MTLLLKVLIISSAVWLKAFVGVIRLGRPDNRRFLGSIAEESLERGDTACWQR
jgi:hypothetical protein